MLPAARLFCCFERFQASFIAADAMLFFHSILSASDR